MSPAKPIPYVFTPQRATKKTPARPGVVAQAIESWSAFKKLHKDLTAGDTEPDVLGRWARSDFSRLFSLSNQLLASGANEACILVCDAMLEVLNPGHEHADKIPTILYYRGTAGTNGEMPDWGVPDLRRLVDDYVEHGETGAVPAAWSLNNLAWAYYCAGDYENGVTFARRSVELDPGNGPGQSTLAGLLWKVGDQEGALQAFAAGYEEGVGPEPLPEDMQNDPRLLALTSGEVEDDTHDDDDDDVDDEDDIDDDDADDDDYYYDVEDEDIDEEDIDEDDD